MLAALLCLYATAGSTASLSMNWATTASNVVNVADVGNLLGAPDGVAAQIYNNVDGDEESATFSGFGGGDVTSTNSASLASLLSLSQAIVDAADFIAFDFQGVSAPFEQSRWTFSDGTNSFLVNHEFPFGPATGISALGSISASAYEAFFGPLTVTPSNDFTAYILFDIDGNSQVDVGSANFSARIDAGKIGGESPDIDALGTIAPTSVIPIPAALPLLLAGLGLLGAVGWRRRGDR